MAFLHKQLTERGGFGHDLRELRDVRGVSIEQLSAKTKIHPSVILALEEERLEDLKDPLYAERHVRALVTVLEGRPAYYVKKYQELIERSVVDSVRRPARPPRTRDFFVLSHAIAFVGFLLFVAVTAAYLLWQGYVFQDKPRLVVLRPVDGEVIDTPHITVRGVTDVTASVTVNGRSAVVDRDGQFSVQFDVPRGATTLVIEARRRFGDPTTEVRQIRYERASAAASSTR
jgi:hypothetical protein